LSSACRERQEYYKFPAPSELFQSPVKTSLVKQNSSRKAPTAEDFFWSLPSSSFLITATCPELKLRFQKRIAYHSAVIVEEKFHKRNGNAGSSEKYTGCDLTDSTADEIA